MDPALEQTLMGQMSEVMDEVGEDEGEGFGAAAAAAPAVAAAEAAAAQAAEQERVREEEANEAKLEALNDGRLLILTLGFQMERTKSNAWSSGQRFAGTPRERRETRCRRAQAVTHDLFVATEQDDIVLQRWPSEALCSQYTNWLGAYNISLLQRVLYPTAVLDAAEREHSEQGGLHFGDTPRRPQALCALLYQLLAVFDPAHIAFPHYIVRPVFLRVMMLAHKVRDLGAIADDVTKCAQAVVEEASGISEDVVSDMSTADFAWQGCDIVQVFSPGDPEAVLLCTIRELHFALMRDSLGLDAAPFGQPVADEHQLCFVETRVELLRSHVAYGWADARVGKYRALYADRVPAEVFAEFEEFLRAELPDDGSDAPEYLAQMLLLDTETQAMAYPRTLHDLVSLPILLETTRHMAAMFGSCERSSSCSGSAVLNLQLAACNSTWGNRATAWMVGRIVMHLVMEALAEAKRKTDTATVFTQAADYMVAQRKTRS